MKGKADFKKAIKLAVSTFGSYIGASYGANFIGDKIHMDYGKAIAAAGLFAGGMKLSESMAQKQPEIALGITAGTGLNSLVQIAKIPMINNKLPPAVQDLLSGSDDINHQLLLNGVSDHELYGDPRVQNLARAMAQNEVNEYQTALAGYAEERGLLEAPLGSEYDEMNGVMHQEMHGMEDDQLFGEDDEMSGIVDI
jgi:hypothetical protein